MQSMGQLGTADAFAVCQAQSHLFVTCAQQLHAIVANWILSSQHQFLLPIAIIFSQMNYPCCSKPKCTLTYPKIDELFATTICHSRSSCLLSFQHNGLLCNWKRCKIVYIHTTQSEVLFVWCWCWCWSTGCFSLRTHCLDWMCVNVYVFIRRCTTPPPWPWCTLCLQT